MNKILLSIVSIVIIVGYFFTIKEQNNIENTMKIEAKIIAQSSKIFLVNLAIDELKNKIILDMQTKNIKAIKIKDSLLDENIIVAFKDKNGKIFFVDNLPFNNDEYANVKENIIERKSYTTNILGELTLFYENNFIENPIIEYKQLNFLDEESIYLKEKREITICVDPNWMPFEQIKNKKLIGITADYVNIFSQLLGVPMRLILTKSWTESLIKAENRECDILTLVSQTDETLKFMNFFNTIHIYTYCCCN